VDIDKGLAPAYRG